MSELLGKIAESLMAGNIEKVVSLTQAALDGGASPQEILDQGLLAGMDVVG
jgi:5-methyltetrahydrofolate--homocysteine methyltransferase